MNRGITFRTPASEKKYQKYLLEEDRGCFMCRKELLVAEFKFWVLLENRFPYDAIAKAHWLLATKRHIARKKDLFKAELEELDNLLEKLSYDLVIINKVHKRSVRPHYHLHLLVLK